MQTSLNYSGLSVIPSDYEAPDGQLAVSLNLIHEDGKIKPVSRPKRILNIQEGESILLFHKPSGQEVPNIIVTKLMTDTSTRVSWITFSPDTDTTVGAVTVTFTNNILEAAVLGNTIILATASGLIYLLWKDGDYHKLSDSPPFVNIEFGMQKVDDLGGSSGDIYIPATCSPAFSRKNGPPSESHLGTFTQSVYGLINADIQKKVIKKGYFYQPFFVRYAFRLYDGSYSWHSAPVLMLPTLLPPLVSYYDEKINQNDTYVEMDPDSTIKAQLKLRLPYFKLLYRIIEDNQLSKLEDWKDIVAGIDIFISAPIYTYDQSKDMSDPPVAKLHKILGNVGKNISDFDTRADISILSGIYADSPTSAYCEHSISLSDEESQKYYVNILPHERFNENICNAHLFYKVASIPIGAVEVSSSMEALKFTDSDFSNLVTRESLPDDYQSHHGKTAETLFSFNSRINLANVSLSPPKPFSLRSCVQFENTSSNQVSLISIKVWSRLNGVRCFAARTPGTALSDASKFYSILRNFPRYIYYPDSSAYKMEITTDAGDSFILDLKPHDFLNGAYYFRSDCQVASVPKNADPEESASVTAVDFPSKIYTSEVNNPFSFPLEGINTVGSGEILALSTAAKALSQGQFGQFPLYAFTSEGVWALALTSTGLYSAVQPITRDVCLNPKSITQIDSAVLFPSQRGIMILEGASVRCLSDAINTDNPFPFGSLPHSDKLHRLIRHSDSCKCIETMPFSKFMEDCSMLYDYPHQRIIIFSPAYKYAYILSLKSASWGMMYSQIVKKVNTYPDAMAVTELNQLVNFSEEDDLDPSPPTGLLLSRPLSLGMPDTYKTVNDVIQRGVFAQGHVQSVLYGSRDLIFWHFIDSSRSHRLRSIHGSPYKYYRIAVVCDLSPHESISGASVLFTPKFTNKLR